MFRDRTTGACMVKNLIVSEYQVSCSIPRMYKTLEKNIVTLKQKVETLATVCDWKLYFQSRYGDNTTNK